MTRELGYNTGAAFGIVRVDFTHVPAGRRRLPRETVRRLQLLARIAAILPDADLVPVTDPDNARVGRLLAVLPVQLVVPRVELVLDPWSPSRISLLIAWLFLTLAMLAVATLLRVMNLVDNACKSAQPLSSRCHGKTQ